MKRSGSEFKKSCQNCARDTVSTSGYGLSPPYPSVLYHLLDPLDADSRIFMQVAVVETDAERGYLAVVRSGPLAPAFRERFLDGDSAGFVAGNVDEYVGGEVLSTMFDREGLEKMVAGPEEYEYDVLKEVAMLTDCGRRPSPQVRGCKRRRV